MGIQVRRATFDDIPYLMDELKKFAQFYASKHSLFPSEEYGHSAIHSIIKHHFMLVAENADAKPIGFIGGMITPHMFNPNIKVFNELFWWVQEEHRKSRAGSMLLEAYIAWGKENADWLLFTLEENSPVNDRCLTNRGFKLKERNYVLEVN